MYKLFYDGEAPPKLESLPRRKTADEIAWGSFGKDARFLSNFRRLLGRIEEKDRKLPMALAQKVGGSEVDGNPPQPETLGARSRLTALAFVSLIT